MQTNVERRTGSQADKPGGGPAGAVRAFLTKITWRRVKNLLWILIRYIIVFGLCFVVLYPFLVKILSAFMSQADLRDPTVNLIPRHFSLYFIRQAWIKIDYIRNFVVTLSLSLLVAVTQTMVCTLAGYGFGRFRFRFRGILFAMVLLILLIPPQTVMTSTYMYFRFFTPLKFNLLDSLWPFLVLSLTGTGFRNGLFIFIMRQIFSTMPRELEEAAYIDGCGAYKTFFSIMLPNAGNMITTVFVLAFAWQWTDTYYTNFLFNHLQTLPRAIFSNIQAVNAAGNLDPLEYSILINTATLLALIPLVIVFAAAQNRLVQSVERSGLVE